MGYGISVSTKKPGKPISERSKKAAVKMFKDSGHSTHSGNAELLGAIVEYCEENEIPYTIQAMPKKGYYIAVQDIHVGINK